MKTTEEGTQSVTGCTS